MTWKALDQNLIAKAIYPFSSMDVPHGLTLRIGDTLIITSKLEDWCYGYCILKSTTKSKTGIFPINYVRIIGKDSSTLIEKRSSHEYSTEEIKTNMMTTIAVQLSSILKNLTELEEENENLRFAECEIHFNKLIELYYEIANWSVNKEELMKMESQMVHINKLNNFLRRDVAVRVKPFSISSVVNLSLMELDRLYQEDSQIVSSKNVFIEERKSESNLCVPISTKNCLQIVVENFELVGFSEDFLLQWMIIDISNDIPYEIFWQSIKEVKKGRPLWMGEKFLYADISEEMMKDNLYLVVSVFRVGQLLLDPNKQTTARFKRPLAFGYCSLKDIFPASEKTTINLHSINENDFLKSHKEMIRMKFPTAVQFRWIHISVTIVDLNRARMDGTDDRHILRSLILSSDKPYEYDRNSLYIKLDSAEFEKANKTSPKNVEAQINILTNKGIKIPCFSINPEKDNRSEYISHVIYHCNSPRWRDIIKIDLEEVSPDDAEIIINFYHCSTKDKRNYDRKYFASCFLNLSEFLEFGVSKKTFILPTQKLSENNKENPKGYLFKNSNLSLDNEKSSVKEFCKIELYLCSTFISNNKNINNFLRMRFHEDISTLYIRDGLMEIQNIKNKDFLKPNLRKEIMNTIKTLIIDKVYHFSSKFEGDLFITWQTLCYKYIQFDLTHELISYLKGYFGFLDCLLKGIQYVINTMAKSDISFEVLHIVFGSMKPTINVLTTITETDHQYEISENLKEILKWFIFLFEGHYKADPTNDIRILIFRFIIDNLKNIYKLLSKDVVVDFFNTFFNTIDFKNSKILTKEKLEFFQKILNSDIYEDCFDVLVTCFHPSVEICLTHIDIGSSYMLIAAESMLNLFRQYKLLAKEDQEELINQPFMKTLFIQTFSVFTSKYYSDIKHQKYNRFINDSNFNPSPHTRNQISYKDETKISMECQKLCTLLVAYLEEWVQVCNESITLREFAIVLENVRLILERNIYPKLWLSMHLKVASVCGAILQKISKCFENNNEEAYEMMNLSYFETCFTYIMQNCLQLQNFPLSKSQAILEKFGDMRIYIMDCFLNVWKNKPSNLDFFDKDFIVQVTRKVLNISFISTSGIRCKTIPLLIHTIANWLDKSGDIKEVLNDLISETELLLRGGLCDETYCATLNQILQSKRISSDIEEVIESFAMLINLHLEYRKVSSGSYHILHMEFILHAFMKFYQDKVGIFTHFQHYNNKFSQILESEEHYFEAALVLKQQYDLIHWNSEEVTFDNIFYKNYDGISNEVLKEQLVKRIIELLNEAKEFEYAAELCQELHSHYLSEYKYKELAPLLNQWARYYELIMTEARLMLNYYRVTFIGGTLPSYMKQNNDYIVKGSMWFKTNTIMSLLQSAFPNAKIKIYQSSPPSESQEDAKMTIYLAKMEPIPSDVNFSKNDKISFKIRSFYKDHKINCFFSDHPYHKGIVDKNNEVKSLHVSRILVLTNMMIPNEFMWNPIIHVEREVFTPIDVAIETVEKKNMVIQEMIHELEENPSKDLRPFTMLLTGTLDAGVNGGMPKYIEAFFSDESNQIDTDLVNCFQCVLMDQKNVLADALVLHRKLASTAILPMHERLEECFTFLKKSIIDLDVTRKRSFSNMRNLDDIYAHIHNLIEIGSNEMEKCLIQERSKIQLRKTLLSGTTSLLNLSDKTHHSSNCSSPDIVHKSTTSRSSQSELDVDKSKLNDHIARQRVVSSCQDDILENLAVQYVNKQRSLVFTPSQSSPDIRPMMKCVSLEDSKPEPLKSPPLPPRETKSSEVPIPNAHEDIPTGSQSKSLKASIWKTLVSRGKELTTNNGKYTLEPRRKSKPNALDLFKKD